MNSIVQSVIQDMGLKKFWVFQGFLALLLLAACASPPERVLSSNAPSYATLPNGSEPLNPTQPSPIYAAVTAIPGDNLVRYLERKRGHVLDRTQHAERHRVERPAMMP